MILPQWRWLSEAARPVVVWLSAVGVAGPVSIRRRITEMTDSPDRRRDEHIRALEGVIAAQQQALRTQRGQIARLSAWRSKLGGFKCRLIEARVIAVEPLPLRNRRLVNVGTNTKAAVGDIVTTRKLVHEQDIALPPELLVLGSNYVVGRMVDCAAFSGTLQLLTDPSFEMPAALWRLVAPGRKRMVYVKTPGGGRQKVFLPHDGKGPGLQAVGDPIPVQATGDGRGVVVRNVPAYYQVRAGDLLTTPPDWQLAPFGLRIGKVVRIAPERANASFVAVHVEPFADLPGLSQVYVVQPVSR